MTNENKWKKIIRIAFQWWNSPEDFDQNEWKITNKIICVINLAAAVRPKNPMNRQKCRYYWKSLPRANNEPTVSATAASTHNAFGLWPRQTPNTRTMYYIWSKIGRMLVCDLPPLRKILRTGRLLRRHSVDMHTADGLGILAMRSNKQLQHNGGHGVCVWHPKLLLQPKHRAPDIVCHKWWQPTFHSFCSMHSTQHTAQGIPKWPHRKIIGRRL